MKKQRSLLNLIWTMIRFTCFHLFLAALTFGISLAGNNGTGHAWNSNLLSTTKPWKK